MDDNFVGWETIHTYACEVTQRMRCPGGWIYRTVLGNANDEEQCVAMVFVPLHPIDVHRSRD